MAIEEERALVTMTVTVQHQIHTVRLDPDGRVTATYAERRDEATYRTAVDRAVEPAPSITIAEPA